MFVLCLLIFVGLVVSEIVESYYSGTSCLEENKIMSLYYRDFERCACLPEIFGHNCHIWEFEYGLGRIQKYYFDKLEDCRNLDNAIIMEWVDITTMGKCQDSEDEYTSEMRYMDKNVYAFEMDNPIDTERDEVFLGFDSLRECQIFGTGTHETFVLLKKNSNEMKKRDYQCPGFTCVPFRNQYVQVSCGYIWSDLSNDVTELYYQDDSTEAIENPYEFDDNSIIYPVYDEPVYESYTVLDYLYDTWVAYPGYIIFALVCLCCCICCCCCTPSGEVNKKRGYTDDDEAYPLDPPEDLETQTSTEGYEELTYTASSSDDPVVSPPDYFHSSNNSQSDFISDSGTSENEGIDQPVIDGYL